MVAPRFDNTFKTKSLLAIDFLTMYVHLVPIKKLLFGVVTDTGVLFASIKFPVKRESPSGFKGSIY